MALPVIETPKFDVKIPSTGNIIKVRPFLVKEQKVVLHAIEMKDSTMLNNAVDDVLNACVFNKINIDDLTVYDVEHLITQIRARSVGDIVEINYICQNHINDKLLNAEALKYDSNAEPVYGDGICETKIPVNVNLASMEPTTKHERPDNRIMFTDTLGVVMGDMRYGIYKQIAQVNSSNCEVGIKAVASCIETIINGDEVHSRKSGDFTDDELIPWIEQLVNDDFEKLENYISSMPTMRLEMTLTCPNCGAKESIKLEGLDDFLV